MPAPNTPTDIIDRLRALERKVDDLAGRVNIRPALNTIVGGSVTIKEGGQLIVQDNDGTDVFSIGRLSPDVDGQPQQAMIVRRMDGSLALAIHTTATTGAQKIVLYDRRSKAIFADDIDSAGGGLALPWLPLPPPLNDNISTWAKTSSTSYATVLRSRARLHHPKLQIRIGIGMDTATSGNLRFLVNGVVVATGDVDSELNAVADVPDWDWNGLPQDFELTVQARRTSGTGSVYAQTRYVYGRQN
jgi:hypothetical protein